jgi:hypothetical protein
MNTAHFALTKSHPAIMLDMMAMSMRMWKSGSGG